MTTPQKYRVALGWALALVVLFLAEPDPRSIAAGIPPALAGLTIRGVAAGTIRKGSALAEAGPYAFTRNPLYLGSSLLSLGFGIMSGTLAGVALLLVPSALLYPIIIRNEERELTARYGRRFLEYRDRVPCFFPRRVGRGVLDGFSLVRFRANGEYNAATGFLAAAGILILKYWLTRS
jgi:hypothetical protein